MDPRKTLSGPANQMHMSQLASVGQIAAGIAHEVRNPLTAVKGFVQLLREKYEDPYFDIVESEMDNALRTLENLLQVSKPDLHDEPDQSIHMSVELESVLNLFHDQQYRVQIIKDFQDEQAIILGKRNQWKKAIFNLFKNAFEAMPQDGTLTVRHFVEDHNLHIIISDTGNGIPQDKLVLLGTPFFTTKEDGTGMGLTQIFSVVYRHGGYIDVDSEVGRGTSFTLVVPTGVENKNHEVIQLQLNYSNEPSIRDFFISNKNEFEDRLLSAAVNVKEKIDEILTIGNIDLLANAHKLVMYIVEGREYEMIAFAKTEGVVWSKHALTLAFKLEWLQAIRRATWDFLYNYEVLSDSEINRDHFYTLEKQINDRVDQFLNYFFISYSQYKDELIRSQREMVDNLSVPLIPLSPSICILPLIGAVDAIRASTIEDKLITQIGITRIPTLIIDLSGVAEMEADVIRHLIRILDGVSIMGCTTIITGIRPQIVKVMIQHGLSFDSKAVTKGTLQQALIDHISV